MSTTFGIKIDDEVIEIALRYGIGNGEVDIMWLDPAYSSLSPSLPVIALDNGAQGVSTISDLLNLQQKQ